ncbi:uncharacterized protein PG986_011527 [Apiospora aurea]|uniref:Uncharacterized protein n=1 Tax=Apiospora aurea TaxID=335848 RepID=A0ABR1PXR2_9PEZI
MERESRREAMNYVGTQREGIMGNDEHPLKVENMDDNIEMIDFGEYGAFEPDEDAASWDN